MVRIAGGVPKFIAARHAQDYKITPEQLRSALSPGHRVKLLFMNSPSNPTGAMYSRAELRALGDVLLTTPGAENVWVISDEIYDRIVFDDGGKLPFTSFGEACPELRDRLVTVNGMSKSAAMTGWRIGWTVAPAHLNSGLAALQGHSTSGINSLAQWASLAALKLPESRFSDQVATYRRRRDLLLEILGKAGKIDLFTPHGAFYAFVGVGRCLKRDVGPQGSEDSMGFAERLLQEAQVAVVPGTPFGAPEAIRLSFALDDRSLRTGAERIVQYLK
jgi:aspartate aminotransferase